MVDQIRLDVALSCLDSDRDQSLDVKQWRGLIDVNALQIKTLNELKIIQILLLYVDHLDICLWLIDVLQLNVEPLSRVSARTKISFV